MAAQNDGVPALGGDGSMGGRVVALNGRTTTHGGQNRYYNHEYPPGYRFCPTDSELLVHYLIKKVMKEPLPHINIPEVNLYNYNPEYLAAQYQALREKEWYFFTPRDRKYRNGTRPNRAAGDGYWKATGACKNIEHHGTCIGLKCVLVYYLGKPKESKKTNWIMHEYKVNGPSRTTSTSNHMKLDDWVLCRIRNKSKNSKNREQRDDQDHRESSSCFPEASDPNNLDGFLAKMTNGNAFIRDFDELVAQSNRFIQPPSLPGVAQFTDSYLPNVGNINAYENDHHLLNSYYGTDQQPMGFGPQLVHSMDNIVEIGYFQEHPIDSNLGHFQEEYPCIPNMDNCFASQSDPSKPCNCTGIFQNLDQSFPNNAVYNPSMPPR